MDIGTRVLSGAGAKSRLHVYSERSKFSTGASLILAAEGAVLVIERRV